MNLRLKIDSWGRGRGGWAEGRRGGGTLAGEPGRGVADLGVRRFAFRKRRQWAADCPSRCVLRLRATDIINPHKKYRAPV